MSTPSYRPISDIQDPVEAAHYCLTIFGERDIPIQPVAIAKKMGVMVEKGELLHAWTASYHPGTAHPGTPTGLIKPGTPTKASTIVFQSGLTDVRERFAIAHALAHHCLGHGIMEDTLDSYQRSNPDQRQLNANRFALSLLLPETEIQRVIEHKIASTMEGLTRLFGVSEPALITQLTHLGFIKRTLTK